jgi:hypothetical protein
MPTYKYTSPYPAIFMDLSYGPGVSVLRANGEQDNPAVGATVTLELDDILTVPHEVEHAYLELVTETPAALADPADAPASNKKGK